VRYAFFDITSIMTTTGFFVADHNLWPPVAQAVILLLMLIGGCSGSTAGGVKVVRHVILAKHSANELRRLLYPHGVFSVQLDKKVGRKDLIYSTSGFIVLYFIALFAGILLTASAGVGLYDSLNVSLLSLGNIGLGLGNTTSAALFHALPGYVLYGLSFLMLIGRLELFSMLILFVPEFWRR
jgi:trk system potassium uptake protein TrkH